MSSALPTQSLTRTQIPNGGYGWVCVAAQFLVNGFTWGAVASYSVYLAYYLSHNIFPDAEPLDFALIGGCNFSMAMLAAPFATLMTRLYGVKAPMLLGVFLFPAGYVAASFAHKAWHLYLSQGVLLGLGVGFIYIPASGIIPQWFTTRRSLANGICAAGSGIGGLIMCFSTEAMLRAVGLSWTLRITAIIVFCINLVATILIRPFNAEVQLRPKMFDWHLLQRYHVNLLLAWSFVIMFGYITLMFSLSDYALSIGQSDADSATVAAILNLGAALGRPVIGFASDRWGRIEVAGLLTFACGLLVFVLWLPTKIYGVLLVFALFGGAILGIFWAVIAPVAADIVDLQDVQSLLSISFLSVVLPCTFAEVIALKLRRPDAERSYLYPQIFAGVSYLVGAVIILELWRSVRKSKSHQYEKSSV
ncbi:hypothetical protein GYMLUDRAFT_36287 [Collybiopsis luxurians FD-317 M1]|nr:hypothetical protein GYMLUDRAFT_36287 [Collybiopsis luxurians FD-317 M1]